VHEEFIGSLLFAIGRSHVSDRLQVPVNASSEKKRDVAKGRGS